MDTSPLVDCTTCDKHRKTEGLPSDCYQCLFITETIPSQYLPFWKPKMSKTYDAAFRDTPVNKQTTSKSDGSSADYYVLPTGVTQLQDLISFKNMNAQVGEIFRACYRYGQVEHSEKLRDAKKMMFYAQAEVKRLEQYT